MRADIAIVGGGIVGSSIAYHLALSGAAGRVLVVERDPTYEHAATPRSNGGIRRLFSREQNIQMATFGLQFYRDFEQNMALGEDLAPISFARQGYLFVSDAGGSAQMQRNFRLQEAMGVEVELMDANALVQRFPSISPDGITLAVLSAQDAWIDPHAALLGFRNKARELGVEYVNAAVTGVRLADTRIAAAELDKGQIIEADTFVNACGAWCAEFATMVGIDLPVQPMSRESYFLRAASQLEPLPFIKTESDLAFRPEGQGYVGGMPDWKQQPGWDFAISQNYFEEVVWPALAARIPAMQELRLERSWRGHYARSEFDLSPILGRAAHGPSNFVMANGFSGHGIMHAPAAGRGIAELLLHGAFQTIDLSCFDFGRIHANKPFRELGIV
jgi:FAD-dependent oxidoreductase domain-containing protein 1